MEKEAQTKAKRALSKAKSRTLTLFGAQSMAQLAKDFRLRRSAIKTRVIKNARKARVWVGGNQMSLSRYGVKGATVPGFGAIPGAFEVKFRNGKSAVFIDEHASLPAWAVRSGKAWFPRGKNGKASTHGLVKLAVAGPQNFSSRYAPKADSVKQFFETAFFQEWEKEN